jgi:hypothetical protein
MALPAPALQTVQICPKSVRNEGYFTLESERFLLPYNASHCRGVTEAAHVALLAMGFKHGKFDRSWSVRKGNLFFRSKQFFVPISPRIRGGDWNTTYGTQCSCATITARLIKIGQQWRALYYGGRKSFCLSRSLLALERREWNNACGTPYSCTTSNASLVELGQ